MPRVRKKFFSILQIDNIVAETEIYIPILKYIYIYLYNSMYCYILRILLFFRFY